MKNKKWITVIAALAILVGLVLWMKRRDYSCQRCGAGIGKCGPVIIGQSISVMSGAGGNRWLYCKRNGHILVKKYDHDEKITDWMYQRDSYETEDEYQNDIYFRDNQEEIMFNSQVHLMELGSE